MRISDWSSDVCTSDLFTFVCPTELGDLADNYAELQRLGVEVYSVSTDTHFTHKAWHETSDTIGKIEYFMLGDPTATIATNFDVLREGQGLADRGTFLVDPDGVIQLVEITPEGVGRNAVEQIGRASGRGRGCQDVWLSVDAGALKKKKNTKKS